MYKCYNDRWLLAERQHGDLRAALCPDLHRGCLFAVTNDALSADAAAVYVAATYLAL